VNESLGFLLSLFLPGLLGYVWLDLLWRPAHWAAKAGYGYLLGTIFLAVIFLAWGSMGLTLTFSSITIVFLLFTLIPFSLDSRVSLGSKTCDCGAHTTSWKIWIWWFFLIIFIVRFGGLLLEVFWRPLYPWDAWMNWAPKARVWFGLQDLIPFVHYSQWPTQSLSSSAFSLGNPDASLYPPLVPLVQLWIALGLGEWRDNWINLPWFLCAIALSLAFYGQLRMLKITPLASLLATYLLLSMPYLNTHVALGGYADLWMAAFYCAAVMALIGWTSTRSSVQLMLMLVMAVGCILTKKPGLIWAATLIPGILLVISPKWQKYLLSLFTIVILGTLATTHQIVLNLTESQQLILSADMLQIPGFGTFPITYHSVSQYFIDNIFIRNNWNLSGWLILLLFPVIMFVGKSKQSTTPAALTLAIGILFVFFVFTFTQHYQAAANSTTINRAIFHLAPALFYTAIVAFLFGNKGTFTPAKRTTSAN